jgi:hypothetical protein
MISMTTSIQFDEIIARDLTVNNQANFRKNLLVGLDLTVTNTLRSEGTLVVTEITDASGGSGSFNVTTDLCVATGKRIQCDKHEPKNNDMSLVYPGFINRFGIARLSMDTSSFLVPANTNPDDNLLSPEAWGKIPIDRPDWLSVFQWSSMVGGSCLWQAPGLSDFQSCSFNQVFVQVCVCVKINVVTGEPGDRVILALRKTTGEGEATSEDIAESYITLSAQAVPAPFPRHYTLCICDVFCLQPGDGLDCYIVGHDWNTGDAQPLQVQVIGEPGPAQSAAGRHTHASFKVASLELIDP